MTVQKFISIVKKDLKNKVILDEAMKMFEVQILEIQKELETEELLSAGALRFRKDMKGFGISYRDRTLTFAKSSDEITVEIRENRLKSSSLVVEFDTITAVDGILFSKYMENPNVKDLLDVYFLNAFDSENMHQFLKINN